MNEHSFIKSIHRYIPSETYRWKINDNYAGGVPDAFYCNNGNVLFIEYKYVPKPPKRGSTVIKPDLSANQLIWLRGRHEQGIPVGVVLGMPQGNIIFSDPLWEIGLPKSQLEKYYLNNKGIASIIHTHCIGDKDVGSYGPKTDSNSGKQE